MRFVWLVEALLRVVGVAFVVSELFFISSVRVSFVFGVASFVWSRVSVVVFLLCICGCFIVCLHVVDVCVCVVLCFWVALSVCACVLFCLVSLCVLRF